MTLKKISCPLTAVQCITTCILLFAGSPMIAGEPTHPVRISGAQISGEIFQDYEPEILTHEGGNVTHDVEVFRSSNELFDTGMYRSGKVRSEITEPYGVNEYMHFIEGGVTLTSSDGAVTEIVAGDSVVIPKEWTGTWDTEGYLKIYVIYSPDAPIE